MTAILPREKAAEAETEANPQALLDALNALNHKLAEAHEGSLQSRIESYENSFRMQTRVASVQTEDKESDAFPNSLPRSVSSGDWSERGR